MCAMIEKLRMREMSIGASGLLADGDHKCRLLGARPHDGQSGRDAGRYTSARRAWLTPPRFGRRSRAHLAKVLHGPAEPFPQAHFGTPVEDQAGERGRDHAALLLARLRRAMPLRSVRAAELAQQAEERVHVGLDPGAE